MASLLVNHPIVPAQTQLGDKPLQWSTAHRNDPGKASLFSPKGATVMRLWHAEPLTFRPSKFSKPLPLTGCQTPFVVHQGSRGSQNLPILSLVAALWYMCFFMFGDWSNYSHFLASAQIIFTRHPVKELWESHPAPASVLGTTAGRLVWQKQLCWEELRGGLLE